MGSWDCYCALCGCPLSSRNFEFGSREPYALAARRYRVERAHRDPREWLDESDEEVNEEVSKLDEALRREQPGKSLSQFSWYSGYDPEVVEEKDVEWLGTCRSLGLNRGNGKAYLSPRGYYGEYGSFLLNQTYDNMSSKDLDPNDPKITDLFCYNPDRDPVFPFHEACYIVLARALHNDPDTTRIDKDALYTTMIEQDYNYCFLQSLWLDYGHFDWKEQTWPFSAGYEHLVCDPSLDPAISAKVQHMLPPQLFISAASMPDLPPVDRCDPFATLPYDILHMLLNLLTATDILSVEIASSHVSTQIHIPTFWKSMIVARILPWFPELKDLCTTVLFASTELNFRELSFWLDSVTQPTYGMVGPFMHIANRRRIMHAVKKLIPLYLNQLQERGLSTKEDSSDAPDEAVVAASN